MLIWLLDKNPGQILDNNLTQIQIKLEQKNPNIILCSEPFDKALNFLID